MRADGAVAAARIVTGSAFDPATVAALDAPGYDLVITNPPYVRYQSQNGNGAGVGDVRRGLSAIVDARMTGGERALWQALVEGYSGLADLSVPAWLLSALLTRPGGRLALVVPATWRSRDYADVVRYLLLRAFRLEYIVADTQPGWFSDALVRTHLVIARRLSWDEAQAPVSGRSPLPTAPWLQVAPAAAGGESLGGRVPFPVRNRSGILRPGRARANRDVPGIESRQFALDEEWRTLEQRLGRKTLVSERRKQARCAAAIFQPVRQGRRLMPEGLRDMLPPGAAPARLQTLEQAGIRVSQGLRSGCNRFFYVTMAGDEEGETVTVEASDSFQNMRVRVPVAALRPVLHRQADMQAFAEGCVPATRALDLSDWVLPEDQRLVAEAAEAYRKRRHVCAARHAARTRFVRTSGSPDCAGPERAGTVHSRLRPCAPMSAGRANGRDVPRFWYMLPAFTARHLPAIFTPRINHGTPAVALNTQPPILIDANFSTLWAEAKAVDSTRALRPVPQQLVPGGNGSRRHAAWRRRAQTRSDAHPPGADSALCRTATARDLPRSDSSWLRACRQPGTRSTCSFWPLSLPGSE